MKKDLKFKHTACRESLKEKKREIIKAVLGSPLLIYTAILLVIYILAFSFYNSSFFNFSSFCFLMGLGSWIIFYSNSQDIVYDNQFFQYIIVALLIVLFSTILLIATKNDFFDYIFTWFPLLYIIYFRLLLFLFFKDFATSYTKPTILFAKRGGKWTHENPNRQYVCTKKEVIFSDLLFFGPPALALIAFYLINLF